MEHSHIIITIIMVIQLILVSGLLIAWQALGAMPSRGAWLLRSVAIGALLLLMDRLLDWTFLSYRGRYVVWGLFALALITSGVRAWGQPLWIWPQGRARMSIVVSVIILAGTALPLMRCFQGLRVPGEPVDLTFPLRDGCFHVAHGGSRKIINAHIKVAAPDLHDWRGQMWGLDIVKLYPAGNRARGFFPQELRDYAIFGEPIYAPCGGEVVAVEDDLPDLIPPESDSINKAGNYVLIECGDEVMILLAHLKRGSVVVEPGQCVAVGDRLGEIGNSGNTTEPHLHIHAQRGVGAATLLDAEPRPATFDGVWLVRNDRVCFRK
jgi:hypothetical protein